jgi:hypothetical protein
MLVIEEAMVEIDKSVAFNDVENELDYDEPAGLDDTPDMVLSSMVHASPRGGSREPRNAKWPARARASFYLPRIKPSAQDHAEVDVGSPCCDCLYASFHGDKAPLKPSDALIRYWEIFMVSLLLYVTFVTTYEIAFVKRDEIVFDGLFWINRLVDLGFVFDLWINFNVGFEDEEGVLIMEKKVLRKRYIHGWFGLDVLALLPFGMIGYIVQNDAIKDMAFMRLIRLLRLMKLARLMKASRIIQKVMMSSDLLMRQWAFIKTFLLLALFFHWSVCGLMILTDLEGADPNWQTVVRLAQEGNADLPVGTGDGDGDGGFAARFLKAGGSGGSSSGSSIIPETNWYLEGAKYSLAVFGVWAFEPPAMVTLMEGWYSVVMTVFAASFYAYLAGVIVELVSMAGEASRVTNQKLDGIMMYLEEIGYPKQQRVIYKQFFWACRHHFLHGEWAPSVDKCRQCSRSIHFVPCSD